MPFTAVIFNSSWLSPPTEPESDTYLAEEVMVKPHIRQAITMPLRRPSQDG